MSPFPFNPDHDAIQARIDVRLAQNRRLVESWPDVQRYLRRTETPVSNAPLSTAFAHEEKEEGTFTPTPENSELAGIGYSEPKDGERRREDFTSNDKLRVQLLGIDLAKRHKDRGKSALGQEQSAFAARRKPENVPSKRAVESDSDDDKGRTSLGKARQNGDHHRLRMAYESIEADVTELAKPEHNDLAKSRPQKKASNYLDEVLINRSLQKRKKSKSRLEQ